MESEVKGERVAAAAADRARQGIPNGGLGYGWRRVPDSRPAEYAIHEPEATIVRDVIDRLARGESLAGITARLNAEGIPAPGTSMKRGHRAHGNTDGSRWNKTSVKKLALRPSNAGLRVHHRGRPDEVMFQGAWPPLVSETQWSSVRAVLAAPERRASRPAARRHLLSWGIGRCGVCGGLLRVAVKGNQRYGRKAETYTCADRGCVGRNKASLDDLIERLLVTRLARPDAADMLVGNDDRAAAAITKMRELQDRLELAADEYAVGRITVDQLTRITSRLRPELDAAQRELAAATPELPSELLRDVAGDKADEAWSRLGIEQRHLLAETLLESVVVNPVTRRGPGFEPSSVQIVWRRA